MAVDELTTTLDTLSASENSDSICNDGLCPLHQLSLSKLGGSPEPRGASARAARVHATRVAEANLLGGLQFSAIATAIPFRTYRTYRR